MFVVNRSALSLLAAIAVVGAATPARAQEPSIGIEWTMQQLGTVDPGTSFSRTIRISIWNRGTTVYAASDSTVTSVTPASQYIAAGQFAYFTISGTAPTAIGQFTITVNFTYFNSVGPVTTPVWIMGTVRSPQEPTYFVGVIPQSVSSPPSGADCPPGASLVNFYLDDEDSDNENNRAGWIGAIKSDRNTSFYYCRVDGRQFKPLSTVNTVNNHYALIRLGTACPPGSTNFTRYWDNENSGNANSRWTSSGNALDYGPNTVAYSQNSIMYFCLFKSGTDTMSEFPNLGIPYGVFAAPDFTKAVQSGWVYTDDEDSTNDNDMTGDAEAKRIIVPTGSDGRNTTVYLARVTPETRPVARCSVSPDSGIDSVHASFSDDGSFARAGRTISSYSWSFSSGSTASGPGPHSQIFDEGIHWGRLTVTDSAGESSQVVSCPVIVSSSSPGGCLQGLTRTALGEDPSLIPSCPVE